MLLTSGIFLDVKFQGPVVYETNSAKVLFEKHLLLFGWIQSELVGFYHSFNLFMIYLHKKKSKLDIFLENISKYFGN